ncbi:MAG: peptidoglycan DD-metalloendopeptidase family protein [Bacteroidetes bacterium]|nr:peptidoglycan DD-metalloendopeptidase family protein [Bacteroidota bacterium]
MRIIALGIVVAIGVFSTAFSFPHNEKKKGEKSKADSMASSSVPHKSFFRSKKENAPPLIEKMSDEQLLLLIDHMFEAEYMPADLWSEVTMEIAKRNLSKIKRDEPDISCATETSGCGQLHIEKLLPAPVEPSSDRSTMFLYPASNYYGDWEEDLSSLFKDEFAPGAHYSLELENAEYGCFNMPAWGPLSSPFGWRHGLYHKGVDIQLRKGDTVTCAFDGMVRFAQKKGGYGNVVIVRHYNGLETVYAHLSKIKVCEGDVIGAGDLIGLAGSTGHSTGPHLHFETRFMGAPVDPRYFISFDYGNLQFNSVVFKKNKNGLLAAFHPDTEFHTVEKGETFLDIAAHYCITAKELRSMNGITPKQYIRLKQGMVLRVREIPAEESAAK